MSQNMAEDFVALLQSRGWVKTEENAGGSDLWAYSAQTLGTPQSDYISQNEPATRSHETEMYVPSNVALGSFLWTDLIERFALVHKEPPSRVERAIELVRYDVTRFRVDGRQTVPLEAGATVIGSAFGMLRAAATTARRPRQSINGNYSKLADKIARKARLAHTEDGSFVFPVALKVHPPEPENSSEFDSDVFSSTRPESAERRVTRTLAQAISAFDRHVIQRASEPRIRDLTPVIIAGGTKEMFASLNRTIMEPEITWLETGFSWAPIESASSQTPASISIPAESRDLIAQSVQLLSAPRNEPVRVITGPIIRIEHSPGSPVGLIAVQTASLAGSRTGKIEATVRQEQLEKIHHWMHQGTTVVLQGEVERRPGTTSRISGISRPQALDNEYLSH